MKKLAASVGLVALGASTWHSVCAAAPGDASKPWSISASLRGFYDDNIYAQGGPDKTDSFGFSVSPSVGYAIVQDQTAINARYTYSGSWYDKQSSGLDSGKWRH